MKILRNLFLGMILALIGVFFALVLLEVGFRVLAPFMTQAPRWNDRPAFYYRSEAAPTLQDFAYPAVKPAGVFRIAVVGDSYSFAPYMQFTDTFVKKLEQMLNLNAVPLRAEVINYGVPAYSTTHEIALVQRALEQQADLVILQVTLNDAELKPYRPEGIRADQFDRFGAFAPRGRLTKILPHWRSLDFVLQRLHNSRTHREYVKYFYELFENPRGLKSFNDSLQQMREACSARNVKLIAVVMPLFGVPVDAQYPFAALHEKLAALLAQQQIPQLNIVAPFNGIPIERLQVIPGIDRHPNEIAHRILAEEIYRWLESRNFIPPELKIRYRYNERLGISGAGIMTPQPSQ